MARQINVNNPINSVATTLKNVYSGKLISHHEAFNMGVVATLKAVKEQIEEDAKAYGSQCMICQELFYVKS